MYHVVMVGLIKRYSDAKFTEYLILNDSNDYYEEGEDKLIQYRYKKNNKKRNSICKKLTAK